MKIDGRKRKQHRDLTGEIIGHWEVLVQLPEKQGKRYLYKCRCKCGTIKKVLSSSLLSKRSQSCGCLRIQAVSKRPFESLYNRLVTHNPDVAINLSYAEYLEFTQEPKCHYCKELIKWYSTGKKSTAYNLDRKDNSLGYSKENCVVCCGFCNRTKGDRFTYEEFMLIAGVLRHIFRVRKLRAE